MGSGMRTSFQIRYGCLEVIEKMIVVLRLRGLTGIGFYKEVTGERREVENASDKKVVNYVI